MNLNVKNFPQEINLCKKYKGNNVSPEISWDLMKEAKSYAIVLEDPKAVGGTFIHWYIPYISTKINSISPLCFLNKNYTINSNFNLNKINLFFGKNSFGTFGYTGPCPPIGTGIHHYIFHIYSLNKKLNLTNENIKITDSNRFENILKEQSIDCLKKESIQFNYKYK